MIFDLDKKDDGIWFDFPGGGRVKLRLAGAEDFIRINKATTEIRPYLYDPKSGVAPRVLNQEITDTNMQSMLYNDCCIVAWEDFFDRHGQPIPCTAENKTTLMRLTDPTFRDFVSEKMKAMGEAAQEAQLVLEKN